MVQLSISAGSENPPGVRISAISCTIAINILNGLGTNAEIPAVKILRESLSEKGFPMAHDDEFSPNMSWGTKLKNFKMIEICFRQRGFERLRLRVMEKFNLFSKRQVQAVALRAIVPQRPFAVEENRWTTQAQHKQFRLLSPGQTPRPKVNSRGKASLRLDCWGSV